MRLAVLLALTLAAVVHPLFAVTMMVTLAYLRYDSPSPSTAPGLVALG